MVPVILLSWLAFVRPALQTLFSLESPKYSVHANFMECDDILCLHWVGGLIKRYEIKQIDSAL